MTKERLLEAIGENDPDGKGLERVREAALENRLLCHNPGRCLLAEAWSRPDKYIRVSSFFYFFGAEDEKTFDHNSRDVIRWFDSFPNSTQACKAVLEILND